MDDDIDNAFIRTEYNTGEILNGISFNNDNDITAAIKSGVIKKVFEIIRGNLATVEAQSEDSSA